MCRLNTFWDPHGNCYSKFVRARRQGCAVLKVKVQHLAFCGRFALFQGPRSVNLDNGSRELDREPREREDRMLLRPMALPAGDAMCIIHDVSQCSSQRMIRPSQRSIVHRRPRMVTTLVLTGVAVCAQVFAQGPEVTHLTIDLANVVEYRADVPDITKYARNPNLTPGTAIGTGPTETPNFVLNTGIGDIVAVNGLPAKGLFASRSRPIITSTTPSPGQAIADVTRTSIREDVFEILQPDGTPVGSIMIFGLSGGPAPPGQPSTERGNWAIVGGTGAFLGARGQAEGPGNNPRIASMGEDPANRRVNGGGPSRYFLHIIPMTRPSIVLTRTGPAVVHSSDFTLVTPSHPALAGEMLSLFATGLGPTVPAVPPGDPFPPAPLARVNSPVVVTVNGRPAEVLAAVGFPGSVDGYQVNFRLPSDAAPGEVSVAISAAWVAGAPSPVTVK
jgi:hypothetical protein